MPSLGTVFGACALLLGSVGYFAIPHGLKMGIKSIINLDESGMIFPNYFQPDADDDYKVERSSHEGKGLPSVYHLFAITNPTQVLKGAKASFEVKGPYEFTKFSFRRKIEFSEQNQKVTYETKNIVLLNEHNSENLDEKMWLVNPIQLTLISMARSIVLDRIPFKRLAEPLVFNGLNMALGSFGEGLILQTTPRKILLGRQVAIFSSLAIVWIRYGMEPILPSKIFGLVVQQNKTTSQSEVWTGVGKTRDKFADVAKHEGRSEMSVWRGQHCNAISGTNGELYKPFPQHNKPIAVFISRLCRSLYLDPINKHEQLVVTESGVKAYEYELSQNLYRGARSRPEHECFCEDSRTYDCQYDGLMAMGPCVSGAPVYLAQANFKNVNPRIRDLVDWKSLEYLNSTTGDGKRRRMPESQRIRMDPITGLVLEHELTMMVLFKMVRHGRLADTKNIQPLTYMPLFAVSESSKFPADKAWFLRVLQNINDHQALVTLGGAALGAGILALNLLFG